MATLYEPSSRDSEYTPRNGKKFTLAELQALVGGYIEMVRIPVDAGRRVFFVDEEGMLKKLRPKRQGVANRGSIARWQRRPLFNKGG